MEKYPVTIKYTISFLIIFGGAAVYFWGPKRTKRELVCHAKIGPPFLVPQSKYIEIFGPRIVYFNFIEIFGPPEQNFLIYLGPFEIFYPPLNLHSTRCVKGDNLFHL